jgi:hypothetical protein
VTRRARSTIAAALLAVSALAACSGGDDSDAVTSATLGTAPPTTSTTAPVDPYAVPETVDAAYVERVLNKLYEVVGDADRIAVERRSVPPEVNDRLIAVYDPFISSSVVNGLTESALSGFEPVLDPPGNRSVAIDDIREATSTCIMAHGTLDVSQRLKEPVDLGELVFDLRPLDATRDPHGYNPTGWVIRSTAPVDRARPEDLTCDE